MNSAYWNQSRYLGFLIWDQLLGGNLVKMVKNCMKITKSTLFGLRTSLVGCLWNLSLAQGQKDFSTLMSLHLEQCFHLYWILREMMKWKSLGHVLFFSSTSKKLLVCVFSYCIYKCAPRKCHKFISCSAIRLNLYEFLATKPLIDCIYKQTKGFHWKKNLTFKETLF